jgi:hypothetical protein
MARSTKTLYLDVAASNSLTMVQAKQFDQTSRYIHATLMNGNEQIVVGHYASVVLNATRADGQIANFMGTVEDDGTVTVPIAAWILLKAGIAKCYISIVEGESKLSDLDFSVRVEPANSNDNIEQDENYDVLVELLADMQLLRIAYEEGIGEAQAAATAANASAEDAEAWAVGKRSGVDVPDTDETYNNNAKYYAGQANAKASEAAGSAAAAAYSEQLADGSAQSAARSEQNAAGSAADAYRDAERAEQAATTAGYMDVEILDGYLYYIRTDAVDVDFALVDGDLVMEVI